MGCVVAVLSVIVMFLCCRAPVLVAIALIEAGMKFEDAVDLIRKCVL